MRTAFAVEASQASKLGLVHATYASQATCPVTCSYRGAGCYAESGRVNIRTLELNKNAEAAGVTPLDVAREEAAAIEEDLSGRLDLRLHVVGDCPDSECAAEVAKAAVKKMRRHKRSAWSYSHAWKDVDRTAWQGVSVLASCENLEQLDEALDLGWSASIVVDKFPHSGIFELPSGKKAFACAHQTHGTQCVDCRLCLRGDQYLRRRGIDAIAFEVHGSGAKQIKSKHTLVQLGSLQGG
jgi:hypothetical protein